MTDERHARLRALLDTPAMSGGGPAERAETAALLDDAVRDGLLHAGQRAEEVRALPGPPHFTRGDAGGAEGWGYPTLPRPGRGAEGREVVRLAGAARRHGGERRPPRLDRRPMRAPMSRAWNPPPP
jgi:hypothetical protein